MDTQDPIVSPYVPWYRKSKDTQPYILSKVLSTKDMQFHCTACFPWFSGSIDTLWDGHAAQDPQLVGQWKRITQKWSGTIAAGGTGHLFIFTKLAGAKSFTITLSEPERNLPIDNVAWAINPDLPLEPLIVFTIACVILIFNVESHSIVGKLRGHGGPITSLSTHPSQPHLFCTTSRDFSTRIYDVSLKPVQTPNNPHWPPRPEPSLAGPAHGLHMSEPEGEGIGQCVAVMVGGRSGGHKGAALCSAFHPSLPLVATGGMDRAVKIWRIPPAVFAPPAQPRLAREDKPLFSSGLLHKARVLSVNWLADDILVSHSAPALMRHNQDKPDDTYYEQGTVVVWQWLALNRFFPPGLIPQKIMRGTASDYRNSESFKILSAYHLPMVLSGLSVFRSITHDPILLIPMGKIIRILNIAQFGPRPPPKFPADDLVYLTDQMQLGQEQEDPNPGPSSGAGNDDNSSEDSTEERPGRASNFVFPPPAPLEILFDAVEGWDVGAVPAGEGPPDVPDIKSCEVGGEGNVIVGIGEGALFIWRLQE